MMKWVVFLLCVFLSTVSQAQMICTSAVGDKDTVAQDVNVACAPNTTIDSDRNVNVTRMVARLTPSSESEESGGSTSAPRRGNSDSTR